MAALDERQTNKIISVVFLFALRAINHLSCRLTTILTKELIKLKTIACLRHYVNFFHLDICITLHEKHIKRNKLVTVIHHYKSDALVVEWH